MSAAMLEPQESGSNLGIAVIVWAVAFAAGWIIVGGITGAQGLGLVWGIFIALAAFEIARRSFRAGLVLLFLALFAILARGIFLLFQ
jgi:hypothetical protein